MSYIKIVCIIYLRKKQSSGVVSINFTQVDCKLATTAELCKSTLMNNFTYACLYKETFKF